MRAPELPPLPIRTLLALEELESGNVLVRPLARPTFASYGPESDALLQVELFLPEYLRRSGAASQAAFSMTGEVERRDVEVELPRSELPKALASHRVKVAMPCAVLPHRRSRWVIVIPLALTVHVGPDEDLDEVVSREAHRLLSALELSPWETLGLFPGRAHRLEEIEVALERRALPAGGTSSQRKKVDDFQRRRRALSILRSIGRQVHLDEVAGPEPVGLDEPLATLDALLAGTHRRSVLIVGEEGVGKTALVRAWVRRRARDGAPPLVFATSGAQLVAGMSGLGQWQERVRRAMEAAEEVDAVLWIDDLRDLLGDRAGGLVDLPSAIKPWLDEGRVRLLGELTPEAADLLATRQAGLFAAMHPLRVEGQDARAAREALRRAIADARRRASDRPVLREDAIDTVVELTDRFLPYRPFPGKAVRLFEELRASAELAHSAEGRELGVDDVYGLFSLQTGVPAFLLRDDVAWRRERGRELLARRIVGQPDAVERLVETLAVIKAGLAPGDKPLASFLFAGPTGVGKTELARALAELLFGSASRLVRFDMSELADPGAAQRLIHGTDSSEGLLTSAVRQQPFCVILLDEIEKAHPSVFDLLLGVLGEGRLTDARGRTAFFHDAIIVMTSNLGTRHRARRIGLSPSAEDETERYQTAVEQHFRPELVNRIDRIVPFSGLDPAQIREVAELVVERITARRGLAELGVSLEVSPRALDRLANDGYEEAYGARALRRHLEDVLVAPLARLLGGLGDGARNARAVCRDASDPAPTGRRIAIDERADERGGIVLEVLEGAERSARADLALLDEVAVRRRWARAQLALPTVEELRERGSYLVAELAYGDADPARTPAAMQTELHGLGERLRALDAAQEELESIEELTLGAVLAGEVGVAMRDDALAADLAFREALLELLLFPEPRHEVSLLVQEWDRERGLDPWLGGLLARHTELGWQIRAHIHNDGAPKPPGWPIERAWGVARDPGDLLERLGRQGRDPIAVLLRVRGPNAGTLLALEAGVHRWDRPRDGADFAAFVVRLLTMRAEVTDAELESAKTQPGPVPDSTRRRITPAVREVSEGAVLVDGRRAEVEVGREDYWRRHRAIALTHLLLLEGRMVDRAALLTGPLDPVPEEEAEEP